MTELTPILTTTLDDDRCVLLFFSASWLVKIVDFIDFTQTNVLDRDWRKVSP